MARRVNRATLHSGSKERKRAEAKRDLPWPKVI